MHNVVHWTYISLIFSHLIITNLNDLFIFKRKENDHVSYFFPLTFPTEHTQSWFSSLFHSFKRTLNICSRENTDVRCIFKHDHSDMILLRSIKYIEKELNMLLWDPHTWVQLTRLWCIWYMYTICRTPTEVKERILKGRMDWMPPTGSFPNSF